MKPFVPMLAQYLGVRDPDLLEKDVRLHALLRSLVADPTFGPHLAFKGGTCLIKCYLDYPRFSTDLDFTWIPEAPSPSLTGGTKAFRRSVRPTQRTLETWFRTRAESWGYRAENPELLRYGQSNRMMTVNLRYPSVERANGLVKVQLNFEEPLLYPTVPVQARSLLLGPVPPALRLFEGDPAAEYSTPIPVTAYDAREILVEKCRALLTRTAAKGRDLVDLFLLERDRTLRVERHATQIVEKTRRVVRRTPRYRRQAERFNDRGAFLLEEDVGPLLLKPLDMEAFQKHRERVVHFLTGLLPQILA